jgi:hypothetical protein
LKKRRYQIGAYLIAIAFVLAVISFYFVIFAIPLFVAGVLLVLTAEVTVKRRLLTCLVPLGLWIPCSYLFLFAYGWNPKEVYLIPEGYTGPVTIIYGEKCGVMPQTENGVKTFRIPDNGVLITNLPRKGGLINNRYYYLTRAGSRQELTDAEQFSDNHEIPSVAFSGSGIIGNSGEHEISYSELWVYGPKTIGKEKLRSRADSIIEAEVRLCRASVTK